MSDQPTHRPDLDDRRPLTQHGDAGVALGNEILRTVVGSGVHGIAIEGTDDHDEMGVYVEPPTRVLGVARPADHYVERTQPEGARSGPGDVDLVMYSLRKYLRLAIKGNPTVLLPMWCPSDSVITSTRLGDELRAFGPAVGVRRAWPQDWALMIMHGRWPSRPNIHRCGDSRERGPAHRRRHITNPDRSNGQVHAGSRWRRSPHWRELWIR